MQKQQNPFCQKPNGTTGDVSLIRVEMRVIDGRPVAVKVCPPMAAEGGMPSVQTAGRRRFLGQYGPPRGSE